MSTILVSKIPTSVTQSKLENFFSFCGHVNSITKVPSKDANSNTYEIHFESPKALSTALLLNEAELDGTPIEVSEKELDTRATPHAPPPTYSEGHDLNKSDDDAALKKTGDGNYDDISQEEKPKYAIMAQLLANGYIVSDKVISSAIQVDQKNGYSSTFKSFLSSLDEKYIHSQEPGTIANKNLQTAQGTLESAKTSIFNSLSHYFEKASATPYGVKISEFYQGFAKDVQDVHKEATRLVELKKGETDSASGSANATVSNTETSKTA